MADVFDAQRRMLSIGKSTELQEWKVDRYSTVDTEYHAYVGHNYSEDGKPRLSKGAIWMIFRIQNPDSGTVDQVTEYRMGRTGIEGGAEDTLTDEWTNRTTSTYYRYDEVLRQFFNG